MTTKMYDIYVGQTNSTGHLDTLQRHEHRGFTYWVYEDVQTYWKEYTPEDVDDSERVVTQCVPSSKRQGQMARRRFIEQQEAGGLTVKGVRYINLGMMHDLNLSRFNVVLPPIKTIEEFKKFWVVGEFLEINGYVYGPKEYEELSLMGVLRPAMENDLIFQAFPKEECR